MTAIAARSPTSIQYSTAEKLQYINTFCLHKTTLLAHGRTVKSKIRPSIRIVCGARQPAARWQHIARYSQCILFTARIYVRRYISEQKATFGRLAAAVRRQVYGGGGRPTHTEPGTAHTAAPRRVRSYRTSKRAKQPPRRFLIIMKGETLFVGQELNLYYCR